MENFVKPSTNHITFSYDYSKQRYTSQLSITNIHQNRQILTKVYLNKYTDFSVNPVVVYTNPGETKVIRIERILDSNNQRKKDRFITYSIQIDTPVDSYEKAKLAFKAIDYRKEGQKIEYTTEFSPKDNITFDSFDITRATKRANNTVENIKREMDDVQKKIAEKEKEIKVLEQKFKSNCQRTNIGLINDPIKNQQTNNISSKTISLVALIALSLLSLIFGATLNRWNEMK